MQRISVHIPDETKKRINLVAKAKRKAESEVIREALDEGLNVIHPKSTSAQALLDMAKEAEKIAKKFNIKGPKDLSEKHDEYTWD